MMLAINAIACGPNFSEAFAWARSLAPSFENAKASYHLEEDDDDDRDDIVPTR
ncbi:hypothetical protein [Oscillatoria sp. FACHB-1406]|uniref:hypothetical protein n=1 Tax=Oscillatoria sp. FACHB-1406 TaxID=2692846 RepID=UPI0016890796|nr:hypothetical protein [Oscillatoria sp. FACHB-1406]MBD2576535.1 hypothetical protein [Oscillatoria sp. FACHB-1406]